MPLKALTPPKHQRGSKYDYSESVDSALDMLANGEQPGDDGFPSQGTARSAANGLLSALGEQGKAYGARVWNAGTDDEPNWSFALKPGRNVYHGRKAGKASKASK